MSFIHPPFRPTFAMLSVAPPSRDGESSRVAGMAGGPGTFKYGDRVVLFGLTESQDLNGRKGIVKCLTGSTPEKPVLVRLIARTARAGYLPGAPGSELALLPTNLMHAGPLKDDLMEEHDITNTITHVLGKDIAR